MKLANHFPIALYQFEPIIGLRNNLQEGQCSKEPLRRCYYLPR